MRLCGTAGIWHALWGASHLVTRVEIVPEDLILSPIPRPDELHAHGRTNFPSEALARVWRDKTRGDGDIHGASREAIAREQKIIIIQ